MFRKLTAALLAAAFLLSACGPAALTEQPAPASTPGPTPTGDGLVAPVHNFTETCVPEGQFSPEIDYFPEKVTLTHTSNFAVEYHNNYKVVTISLPYPGATESVEYVLVQCGTPAPSGYLEDQIIEVPVRTIITMSTSYLPFLDELGLLDRLVGVDDATYISNPTVLQMAAEGKLATIGYGSSVNVEKALELNPDIIMTYGTGSPEYDAFPVLQQAGLKVVINAEWMDSSPLGRAEWGKFIALFFNQEAAAEALFAEKVQKYEQLKALVANVAEKPTVFTGLPYQGVWNVPGGQSFGATFLRDAGASYLWADDPSIGSLFLSFEAVFEKAQNADFWLNLGFVSTLADLQAMDPRYAEFTAFQKGNVWNYDARVSPNGGNDYFESAVAHPEIVLADLIKIFHPDLLPDHELVYYRQVK
ncbi:MAG: ABC transporter substrate-binding protein [Anaerolineales bacterium]|nr:ABC transporter substrate-binding protein [Anaerolineales bacterium]MCX7608495.1 ABC transporter substrate-binding protein [Anaerolineales bacterium]MDW8227171.1 ABC transporter substrate-binding protein [Anaerolineales bacterium]